MPNPRDELPPLPPSWEVEFIELDPNVVPVISALPYFSPDHWEDSIRDLQLASKRERIEWDPGPSWQEVFRHALAWIPNPKLEAIHVWESEGGYVRSC